ncbi:MAG: hypothetical protein V3U19_03705 [Thermodesulfobacteriota bacterium]
MGVNDSNRTHTKKLWKRALARLDEAMLLVAQNKEIYAKRNEVFDEALNAIGQNIAFARIGLEDMLKIL